MTPYRRFQHPGVCWFLTVNLLERRGNSPLIDRIDAYSYYQINVIAFRRYRKAAQIFPRAGDLSRYIFSGKLPKANEFPQAAKNGASVVSGNGDFGNIGFGMTRIIGNTSMTSIEIRSNIAGYEALKIGRIPVLIDTWSQAFMGKTGEAIPNFWI